MSNNEQRPKGLARDLNTLKQGATGSAAELREFIQQMKGRNPQEVLGIVAKSGLVQAIALATVSTLVFMVIFTIGPYAMKKTVAAKDAAKTADGGKSAAGDKATGDKADASKPDATKGDKSKTDKGASAKTDPLDKPDSGKKTAGGKVPDGIDINKAAKKLGLNDKKDGDPDIDTLLEGKKSKD